MSDTAPEYAPPVTLFVGATGSEVPFEIENSVFVTHQDVGKTARSMGASVVVTPLLDAGFDAADVVTALREVNFDGALRVLASALPDTSVVRSELSALAPAMDIDVVLIDPTRVVN